MKSKNVLWVMLDSILVFVFLMFFFLTHNGGGGSRPAAVWISFIFVLIAYAMLLASPFLIKHGKSATVFGKSLYALSSAYFLLELVIGIAFVFVFKQSDWKIAFLMQTSIFSLYTVIHIVNMLANELPAEANEDTNTGSEPAANDAETPTLPQIECIKYASARLESILKQTYNKEISKKINMVHEALTSGPEHTHISLLQSEYNILLLIDALENAVLEEDEDETSNLAMEITASALERNRRLKALK